jgi:hypothetical protein
VELRSLRNDRELGEDERELENCVINSFFLSQILVFSLCFELLITTHRLNNAALSVETKKTL